MVISNLKLGHVTSRKTRNGRFESTTANPPCTHAAVVAQGRGTKIMGTTDKEPRTPPLALLRPHEHGPATTGPGGGRWARMGPRVIIGDARAHVANLKEPRRRKMG